MTPAVHQYRLAYSIKWRLNWDPVHLLDLPPDAAVDGWPNFRPGRLLSREAALREIAEHNDLELSIDGPPWSWWCAIELADGPTARLLQPTPEEIAAYSG